MKRTSLYIITLSMMTFAACTSDNDVVGGNSVLAQQEQVPVAFGTYVGQNAISRAGAYGEISTPATLATDNGFGLFAYYFDHNATDNSVQTGYHAGLKPNFMYNQQVTGTTAEGTTTWTYTPIKYWPNETGTTDIDRNGAVAGGTDNLSFFAYAPYIQLTNGDAESTPKESGINYGDGTVSGITKISGNDTAGDPRLTFVIPSDPSKSVDLLWGVVPASTNYNIVSSTTPQTPEAGKPNLNLTKQIIGETVDFQFKHALAKLNLKIQGAFNQVEPGGTQQEETKITVEKVTITGVGFNNSGILNLNNTVADKPLWESATGATAITFTAENDNINSDIKDAGDVANTSQPNGVTIAEKNLMASEGFFTLIPASASTDDTKNGLKVEITYYVTTTDANLKKGYSRVQNVITKTITGKDDSNNPADLNIEAGKAYTLKLVLGVTEVKVNVTAIDGWSTETTQQVDLPINVAS